MKAFDRSIRCCGITFAGLACFLCNTRGGIASPIVVGHTGNGGVIATTDYGNGQENAAFVTDGDERGRGVEVVGNTVYYTSTTGDIHLAPYNGGLGGNDSAIFPSPRPGFGIQDLDVSNGVLYALTGYQNGPPIVYALSPSDGHVISSVAIQNHPDIQADGFTVLPNGDFLINDADASTTYRGYSSSTGLPTGFAFTFGSTVALTSGVDYNPDDNSLYFAGRVLVDHSFNPALLRTTLGGTLLDNVLIGRVFEDISVIPEPSPLAMCGSIITGLTLLPRRLRHYR